MRELLLKTRGRINHLFAYQDFTILKKKKKKDSGLNFYITGYKIFSTL